MTWRLVKWKDLLIGESKGPAILLTCGRGYACIFPQGAELPIWIPDRLIRHVAVPQTPGSSTAATTKKEKGHSSAPASAAHLKSPADSKTIGSRDPRRTTHWAEVMALHKRPWSSFSSVQSLSRVWRFATLWIAACQASLSITISWSSLRLTFMESVMPSSHLILCRPSPSPPAPNLSQHQSFPVSQLFPSGDQITGASPSASVLPMSNTELPLTLLGGSGVVSASFTERCIMFAPVRAVAFVPY